MKSVGFFWHTEKIHKQEKAGEGDPGDVENTCKISVISSTSVVFDMIGILKR